MPVVAEVIVKYIIHSCLTSLCHNILLNIVNMFYIVYIIPKRDFMSICNYIWKHVDCGRGGRGDRMCPDFGWQVTFN